MNHKRLYQAVKYLKQFAVNLKISPERVLQRAGLPVSLLEVEANEVDAQSYFAIWEAVFEEAGSLDPIMDLAIYFARGPFVPPLFAFSCSPNIETGFKRLNDFKPLMGPLSLIVDVDDEKLTLTIKPSDDGLRIPEAHFLWELIFFMECCRAFTLEHITPISISCPKLGFDTKRFEDYFGIPFGESQHPTLNISIEDAHRPLISENEALWSSFEKDLRKQLLSSEKSSPMSLRVRNALLELLPSGMSSSDAVADKLMVGKRTLQRQLKAEGQNFQQILDDTRSELSMHYLKQEDISIEEISYLLAYREPNSFYRAFHSWTGMTPAEARTQA